MAGYSTTALVQKLGIRPGLRVRITNAPQDYLDLVSPLPSGVTISSRLRKDIDIWHVFTTRRVELEQQLSMARNTIRESGMVWVSWPKKASGVDTDVTGDTIREVALPLGLVDIKVCAINDVWSGLKLVIRKALRS